MTTSGPPASQDPFPWRWYSVGEALRAPPGGPDPNTDGLRHVGDPGFIGVCLNVEPKQAQEGPDLLLFKDKTDMRGGFYAPYMSVPW